MAETALSHSTATILVIDDEMSIQMLAAQALRKAGYQVLLAADTQEALHVAEQYPADIDLVLTDIMLPSGNGIALARALLAKRPNTPVLYMSGFSADAIQAVQQEGGPNGGFLSKPFLPRALVERVRAIVPLDGNLPMEEDTPESPTLTSAVPSVPASAPPGPPEAPPLVSNADASYRLETAVRCPQCGESITTLKAVRLLRTQVNFTSTLPRRGRVLVCPECSTVVPGDLTNL